MEKRIRNYLSAAAFPDENPSQPVAWVLQYPNRMIGTLYTMEAHRRKGLGLAVTASLCRSILEDSPNILPYGEISEKDQASINLFKKLGFVQFPLRHYFDIETK